ncbi:restriction endonuclease subunit S [Clostridium butanoliproducens]|uniref:restriction endonuclease subunit S n=1 Tax=Clostridium butanoliproducens TaxID=2991837 RepID=UPI0024BBB4AF|nr:restriction endonuclease subunit S [Clostridium butanoliproducens]
MDNILKCRIERFRKGEIPKDYVKERNIIFYSGWDYQDISNVMENKNNLRIPLSEQVRKNIQGEYPYYGPTQIQDYIDRYTIEGEHVLIGEDGDHFLKYSEKKMTLLVDGKFNVNNHAHVLKGSDRCITKWFFYYYQHRNIFDSLTRQGAGRYKLTKESLGKMKIALPSIEEQTKITNILSTWDKAIELKEKLIEEKKKQKTGLMQKVLTGKIRLSGFDKEWVNVELKKILKQRNEKSEIKEGLELYSLTIENGVTPKTDRYNREFLVKSGNKKYKITKCNDIVYNPANLRFGAIAVNRIKQSVLLSPIYEVLYIKDEKKYDIDFVGQLLTWDRNIQYFSTMAEGTLVERMAVKIDAFLDVAFKFPPSLEEQKAIAAILSLADKEICILKKEVISLKKQKKGLMQLLLTGIVRVNTQES